MTTTELDAVEKAVAAAEAKTGAEIIVAVNRRSGRYLEREALFATVWAALALVAMVVVPWWDFGAYWFVLDALAVGLLVFVLTLLVTPLRRAVAGRRRREENAAVAARNAFHLLAVSGTKDRSGLLVFVSRFEDSVHLLPDFGIQGKIPEARWIEAVAKAGRPSAAPDFGVWLKSLVETCGAILAEKLPPGPANPDELPNRPRLEVH